MNKKSSKVKQIWKEFSFQSGFLAFAENSEAKKSDLKDEERIQLLKAKNLKAEAVFFRRFENRSSLPLVYVYDFTETEISEETKGELHKFIWNSGAVPLFIIFQKAKIEIFNSSKKVDLDENGNPRAVLHKSLSFNETIELAAIFSSLENGTFWDQKENINYLQSDSAYSSLLKELKTARTRFIKEINVEESFANKLLLISILIKYLEERTGADNKRILYFKKYNNAKNFCDVIEKNQFLNLLNDLSTQMNGKVFELSASELKILKDKNTNLQPLAEFLSAKLDGKQYVLWPLYSFNHLPVELISGIYEEFLPREKSTVYTPPLLVQLLIDQSMPIHTPRMDLKIFDPACGSGIFLVSAFQRKVDWWKIENYKRTGEFQNPDLTALKKILRESIFGADVQKEAVQIAIFSLSIALCDYLEPTKIWTELRFDDLSEKNILAKNFFTYLKENPENDFDLVIGNPPFKNFDKEGERDEEALKIHKKELEEKQLTSPQKQIAFLFLKYSMQVLKPNGLLCLVMPSAPLLYNDTLEYRNSILFNKYNVPQILDFTFMDKSLFQKRTSKEEKNKESEKGKGAIVPTAVVFVQNKEPDEKDILHIVIRDTVVAKNKLYFEIDSYDFHYVPKKIAKTKEWIWKVNLLGGGRIYDLIDRLSKLPTLGEYINEKEKKSEWIFNEGYEVGQRGSYKGKFIQRRKHIISEAITEDGKIDINKTELETSESFYRERKEELFLPPLMLFRQVIGEKRLPIALVKNVIPEVDEKYVLFKDGVIGLHVPQEDSSSLEILYKKIHDRHSVYRFILIATCGQLAQRATEIKKKNIESLPYPENDLKLSKLEKIIIEDVLNFYSKLGGYDSTLDNPVEEKQLFEFGNLLSDILNSVYEKNKKKFHQHKIIITPSFVCSSFQYGSSAISKKEMIEKSSKLEESLEMLVRKNLGTSARINRIILFYHEDKIYLIKPINCRFWLKSIAIQDADEILMDLIESGY
ncbi:MAG TPA: N-6 DNA methylase [Leptospiraceae bacterium]|nr:N-6 DNA methylase [Leptospiraceae bacterium]